MCIRDRVPLAYLLPPIVGLALFQLVFGVCTGRWRGLWFWAAAIPLSAVMWGAALMALLGGHASWQAALGVAAVGHVAAGLAALSLTRGRVA